MFCLSFIFTLDDGWLVGWDGTDSTQFSLIYHRGYAEKQILIIIIIIRIKHTRRKETLHACIAHREESNHMLPRILDFLIMYIKFSRQVCFYT